jgi:mannonate dehydratase
MDRREFGKTFLGGVAGAGVLAATSPSSAQTLGRNRVFPALKVIQNTKLKLGGDYHSVAGDTPTDRKSLEFFKRYAVDFVTVAAARNLAPVVGIPQPSEHTLDELGPWNLDTLMQMQDDCRKMDMLLECVRMDSAYIIMKTKDERDRWLAKLGDNIRKCSKANIPSISYHFTMIPQQRNKVAVVRGGASHNGFTLDPNWRNLPPGPGGIVSGEEYWSRIKYFLDQIIPVAREFKVKMVLHPFDPGGLPPGYLGTTNYNSDYTAGMLRYEKLVDDPYNAFCYDTGVAGESLKDPNSQLDLLRLLSQRGKIAQVHMRNIKGGQNDFQEVFPDMGDVNFMNVIRVLRDTNWSGTILPDHAPSHPDDPKKLQSYAFANGYLLGLIRAANEEAKLVS